MMYAPFGDDDDIPVKKVFEPVMVSVVPKQFFQNEKTECNYLVLFFVVGVFLLAFGDKMKN